MADVTSAISKMLVAETDFNSAMSEAMVQKQSANINALIDNVQFHEELLTGSGNWVCPTGIYVVQVFAAGGGGGGGGGGGSFSTITLSGRHGTAGGSGNNTTFNGLIISFGARGGRGGIGGSAESSISSQPRLFITGGVSNNGVGFQSVARGSGGSGGSGGGVSNSNNGEGGQSGFTSQGQRVLAVIPGNSYPYVSGTGGAGGAGGTGATNGTVGSNGAAGALLLIY